MVLRNFLASLFINCAVKCPEECVTLMKKELAGSSPTCRTGIENVIYTYLGQVLI